MRPNRSSVLSIEIGWRFGFAEIAANRLGHTAGADNSIAGRLWRARVAVAHHLAPASASATAIAAPKTG